MNVAVTAEMESRILQAVAHGRFLDAHIETKKLGETGYSPARVLWLRATIAAYENEGNYNDAMDMYRDAWHLPDADPGTRAVILVEASRIAYRTNDRHSIRRLRFRAEHLWFEHGAENEVSKWKGPTLLNFANHLLRDTDYAEALKLYTAASDSMQQHVEQWCALTRVHCMKVWCLCAMGRPSEAAVHLTAARLTDAAHGDKNAADLAVAKGWIAYASGNHRDAVAFAQQGLSLAKGKAVPDWQGVAEAMYLNLLSAVAAGAEDVRTLADDLRRIASQHRLSYMFRLVKLALTDTREEVRKWGAL